MSIENTISVFESNASSAVYLDDGILDAVFYGMNHRQDAQAHMRRACRKDGLDARSLALLEACEAALPWMATYMCARPDAHPKAVENHARDLELLKSAIAMAKGEAAQ